MSRDENLHEALLERIRRGEPQALAVDKDGMLALEAEHGREGAVEIMLGRVTAVVAKEGDEYPHELRAPTGRAPAGRKAAMWAAMEVADTAEVAWYFGCSTRSVRRVVDEVEKSPALAGRGRVAVLRLRYGRLAGAECPGGQ